jgi:alkanesulfonate monooxygenase
MSSDGEHTGENRHVTQTVRLFSTCPPSVDVTSTPIAPARSYQRQVAAIARWSEAAGCEGMLIYADNRLVEPWLVAQSVILATARLCPLVAVQPAYMHPYAVAKMVATLGYLHGRKIYLNMVAGGFKRDLEALNDMTPHDARYTRLVEYATIVMELARASADNRAVSFEGSYYRVDGLKLTPAVPPEILPELFVSGSSEAGLAAASALGAVAVHYPQPARQYGENAFDPALARGIRVGIIARASSEAAWQVAEARFPPDRRGQVVHQLAMRTSDSRWHKELSERPEAEPDSPYWLRPFHSYQTFCPYLVGSRERVAEEIDRYFAAGFRTFILDVPPNEAELAEVQAVFALAGRAQQ